MATVNRKPDRIASRQLQRAVTLIHLAGRQLANASETVLDAYNRDRLRSLSHGMRELSLPLYRIATRLQRGGKL